LSLARFGPESDVYVIETGLDDCPEFRCCACALICTDEEPWQSLDIFSLDSLIDHLQKHKKRGHKVDEAFSSLAEDYDVVVSN